MFRCCCLVHLLPSRTLCRAYQFAQRPHVLDAVDIPKAANYPARDVYSVTGQSSRVPFHPHPGASSDSHRCLSPPSSDYDLRPSFSVISIEQRQLRSADGGSSSPTASIFHAAPAPWDLSSGYSHATI